jgi:ubiquinone/menaquinone biosynthesis C-methylase UbiE
MLAEGIPMKRSHANADRATREAKARGIEATLKEQVGDVRERDVLDVGTGAGYIASYLAPRCRSLLSVDVVDERVTRDFDFQLVTSETLPMPDSSFDLVISNHVIEHVDDQLLHLQEIRRVLRPGGVCYLATPNKYALLEPHFKLPLLSWLSPAVANLYVRMARKGQRFDVQPLTYSRLAALGKAADLDSSDYSAILARSQVKGLTGVTQCLTDRLHALFPTYVVILRPAQDTRARGDRFGE